MTNRAPSGRAFTLLEVLIAIALALVLCATMFVFLHDMLTTRGRTIEHAERQRVAATLIERIEADLATCLVGDSRSGAGVQGDATHLRILARGVMTQAASRGLDDPAALADLHAVEYQFDPSSRALQARKHTIGESGDFAPLGGSIAHVRFRYLDQRQWREQFDSLASDRLPQAVEVCVWFNRWPGEANEVEAIDVAASRPADEPLPGNFDERAYAISSDVDSLRPPPPDRRRVIVIADGAVTEEAADAQE